MTTDEYTDLQARLYYESAVASEEEFYEKTRKGRKEPYQLDLEDYIDEVNRNTPDPLPEDL